MDKLWVVGFTGYDYSHMDVRAFCTYEEKAFQIAEEIKNSGVRIDPWNEISVCGPLSFDTIQADE